LDILPLSSECKSKLSKLQALYLEDGFSMFHTIVGKRLADYMTSHPRIVFVVIVFSISGLT
jgi:hypothetical protein